MSSDGRWVAYQSAESGRAEIYVPDFPAGGNRFQVSTDGGFEPVWAKNGKELLYRSRKKLISVSLKPGADFVPGPPKILLHGDFAEGAQVPAYDSLARRTALLFSSCQQGTTTVDHQNCPQLAGGTKTPRPGRQQPLVDLPYVCHSILECRSELRPSNGQAGSNPKVRLTDQPRVGPFRQYSGVQGTYSCKRDDWYFVFGPALKVEDWYVRSGETPHLLSMIRSR